MPPPKTTILDYFPDVSADAGLGVETGSKLDPEEPEMSGAGSREERAPGIKTTRTGMPKVTVAPTCHRASCFCCRAGQGGSSDDSESKNHNKTKKKARKDAKDPAKEEPGEVKNEEEEEEEEEEGSDERVASEYYLTGTDSSGTEDEYEDDGEDDSGAAAQGSASGPGSSSSNKGLPPFSPSDKSRAYAEELLAVPQHERLGGISASDTIKSINEEMEAHLRNIADGSPLTMTPRDMDGYHAASGGRMAMPHIPVVEDTDGQLVFGNPIVVLSAHVPRKGTGSGLHILSKVLAKSKDITRAPVAPDSISLLALFSVLHYDHRTGKGGHDATTGGSKEAWKWVLRNLAFSDSCIFAAEHDEFGHAIRGHREKLAWWQTALNFIVAILLQQVNNPASNHRIPILRRDPC